MNHLTRTIAVALVMALLSVVTISGGASADDSLLTWVVGERALTCFPWAFSAKNAPVTNSFRIGVAPPRMVNQINELQQRQQMSGHEGRQPETGIFAVYDPVHHMALVSVGFGEDFSNDLLLTHVSTPPRAIAWRDLSHFHPGGEPIIGMSIAALSRRFGDGRAVSRCGMQAITYGPASGYIVTFILKEGRVTNFAAASP